MSQKVGDKPAGHKKTIPAVPAKSDVPVGDAAPIVDTKPSTPAVDARLWKLPGALTGAGKAVAHRIWQASGATKATRRQPTELPAALERVELKPAQPAAGTPAAKLLASLDPAQRAALGKEAHPVIGKGEKQVLGDVRQRADGNFELDYTLVDQKNRALANDVNRVTLVVGPDGKVKGGLIPEELMHRLGVDALPETTAQERAIKQSIIESAAADLKASRHVAVGATTERVAEGGKTQRVSTVGLRAARGQYSTESPEIMDDLRTGGKRKLTLERGHRGAGVLEVQRLLNQLGAGLGEDGMLGPLSEAAIRQFQKRAGLPETGKVDAATYAALASVNPADFKKSFKFNLPPAASVSSASVPAGDRLENIKKAILDDPRLPKEWANDPAALAAINRVIEKESGWRVGVPNYTITQAGISAERAIAELQSGKKSLTQLGAASSAMGLGQLLGTNMDKYMPSGRAGLGNEQEELRGALAYMKDKYGSPQAALAFHNAHNWW